MDTEVHKAGLAVHKTGLADHKTGLADHKAVVCLKRSTNVQYVCFENCLHRGLSPFYSTENHHCYSYLACKSVGCFFKK